MFVLSFILAIAGYERRCEGGDRQEDFRLIDASPLYHERRVSRNIRPSLVPSGSAEGDRRSCFLL
ncbi:MAG: hypothetical protein AMJ63_09610 [Myxococcales bacterium SG8_38_1]|nr:MAG: hypothetical protein AMJ63_09610 [Myxococcales bacterium SG8_38_1]